MSVRVKAVSVEKPCSIHLLLNCQIPVYKYIKFEVYISMHALEAHEVIMLDWAMESVALTIQVI